ncbi:DNA polymerase beta superfamily protein [Agromyces sp. NPDC057679]|uniref:DNA polymerase beta superfamily protein n=1 Tax=Agromyces sp. NPDC057679 TaxID=3346207 RepID=UPI003672DF3D
MELPRREAANMPHDERLTAEQQAVFPTIIRAVSGSEVHGTGLGEAVSDIDHMGISVEPVEYVLGLRQSPALWTFRSAHGREEPVPVKEQETAGKNGKTQKGAGSTTGRRKVTPPPAKRSEPGDLDYTIYPLRKWARLATAGNPTVVIPVFCSEEHIVSMNEFGESLRANRDRFVTSRLVRRHLSYATHQRQQMTGELSKKVHRKELVSAHGYDVKFAGHYLRLLHQGLGILESGTLALPLAQPYRDHVLAVRRGEVSYDDVLSEGRHLEEALEQAIEKTTLPEDVDMAWLHGWLTWAQTATWRESGQLAA